MYVATPSASGDMTGFGIVVSVSLYISRYVYMVNKTVLVFVPRVDSDK